MFARILSSLRKDGLGPTARRVQRKLRAHQIRQVLLPRSVPGAGELLGRLTGKTGLEIGGPSHRLFGQNGPLPIYTVAERIDNVNFSGATVWEGVIEQTEGFSFADDKLPGRQFLREATDLSGIDDAHYAFLLSSHMLEHTANPIRALKEWIRVLKPGCTLVLLVPYRRTTFDHRRPPTTLSHMIEDFEADRGEDDLNHLEETVALHDRLSDYGGPDTRAALRERSLDNARNRCMHHHVFDQTNLGELLRHVSLEVQTMQLLAPNSILAVCRSP